MEHFKFVSYPPPRLRPWAPTGLRPRPPDLPLPLHPPPPRPPLACQQAALAFNSTLRVERRKRGNAQRVSSSSHEAEGDHENFQSRSPSAKCCELYASLHDRFRLEVRILFYLKSTWKLAAWVTSIIAGMRWWAGRGREGRGHGAQPRWGSGAKPRRGRRGAEPPDCHEANSKCFINKFCHEIRHDLWR